MALKYNLNDIHNIPGLSRPWDSGVPFLPPIFFEIDVLVKYFYNPKYRCEFCSETYGTIECPKDPNYEFSSEFPFGINPNQKVIAWFGDINKLHPNEIKYLETHNVDSDGNIKSEFYDAQINVEFTAPIREVELVMFKTKLSILTQDKFGFRLYKTTDHPISEIISLCSKYKRIAFNSEDDIKRFLSIWNEDLIEDLNVDGIKTCLTERGIKFEKGVRGLKLLELFIKQVVLVEDNIIAPLFFLYDLRLWADHREMQKNYDNIVAKMGLALDVNFSEVYNLLISQILDFLSRLNSTLLDFQPNND